MMPALLKVEYFGGPADGDKRIASASPEYWTADGRQIHRYVRGRLGMEWSGPIEPSELHSTRDVLMLSVGRDGR